MRKILILPMMAAALLISTVVEAHPRLVSSNPLASSTVTAPKELKLAFSEALIPQFSGLQIRDSKEQIIKTGKAATSPDGKQLIVPLTTSLKPGTYQVNWHVTSVDTHRVQGHHTFKVKR
jgi:methionine-rich copper-binding protein CopC